MLNEDIKYFDKIMSVKTVKELKEDYFCWLYPFTNENIKAYYSNIDFNNKSVLTVTSSGDHILNALLLGAKEINAFDSNPLAKYYSELKVAGVKALSYEEFILFFYKKNIMSNSKYYLNKNIYQNKIRKELSNDMKEFWDYVFSKYTAKQLYKSFLFTDDFLDLKKLIQVNNYLNEKDYYILKKILEKKNIQYYDIDIKNLSTLNKKYDVVVLSNIPAFFNKEKTLDNLSKLKSSIEGITKEDSSVVVCYLYGDSAYNDGIYDYNLVERVFNLEDYQYYKFKSSDTVTYSKFIDNLYTKNDSVLMSRKK